MLLSLYIGIKFKCRYIATQGTKKDEKLIGGRGSDGKRKEEQKNLQ